MSWGKLDDVGSVKLMIAGAIAGVAASYMMNEFQNLWSSATNALSPEESGQDTLPSPDEDTTVKAAKAVSEQGFGHRVTDDEKPIAGAAVHYTFGAAVGAIYGVVASQTPVVTGGYGTFYGTAVWLLADEIAVPLVGLSASPISSPLSSHVNALAAHWIYGFTTDLVMRGIVKKIWT